MPKGKGRPYNANERKQAAKTKGRAGFLFEKAGSASAKKTKDRVTGRRAAERNFLNSSDKTGGSSYRLGKGLGPSKKGDKRPVRKKSK